VTAVETVALVPDPALTEPDVGLTDTEKSFAAAGVTLSVSVAVCVPDAPVPVIVMLEMPAAAAEDAVNVSVEDEPELTDDGENDAVTPLGSPLALSETDCELPEVTAVETVAVAFEPAATVRFVGSTETEKSLWPVEAGPRAATPFGVPSPVGPSYPTPAVQRYAGEHDAVWPVVTSFSAPGFAYGYEFGNAFAAGGLASAYIAPMIGEATLVPPNTVHPPDPYES
jgi:hypothetical protein